MLRRSHQKSKHGCLECKRRHIKCDESRPSCVNCTIAKLTCSYTARPVKVDDGTFIPYSISTTSTSSSSPNPDTPTSRPQTESLHQPPGHHVNLLHLELFHHLATDTSTTLPVNPTYRAVLPHFISSAFAHPFLMHEALAWSALHLSLTCSSPSKCNIYLDEAAALQVSALTAFNENIKEVNDENLIPSFLFSALLGLHSFCDAFLSLKTRNNGKEKEKSPDFDSFLDYLIQSIHLLRGITAILFVAPENLDKIRNSEVGFLLELDESNAESADALDDEIVSHLSELAESISLLPMLPEQESKIYDAAVRELIRIYASHRFSSGSSGPAALNKAEHSSALVTEWPNVVSNEYMDLLKRRKPGALVVLGHFAVLLWRCRNFWYVGDAGRLLIEKLEVYLGGEWKGWLSWPKSVVLSDSSRQG